MKLQKITLKGFYPRGHGLETFEYEPGELSLASKEYTVYFETPQPMRVARITIQPEDDRLLIRQITADGKPELTGETDVPVRAINNISIPSFDAIGQLWSFQFVEAPEAVTCIFGEMKPGPVFEPLRAIVPHDRCEQITGLKPPPPVRCPTCAMVRPIEVIDGKACTAECCEP